MTTHYCQLCGKPYKKKYKNQRYCSPDCSQEARRLKSRVYFSRWYTKNKVYCWARKKGTGTLGPHRHDNDESEYEAIQNRIPPPTATKIKLTLILLTCFECIITEPPKNKG